MSFFGWSKKKKDKQEKCDGEEKGGSLRIRTTGAQQRDSGLDKPLSSELWNNNKRVVLPSSTPVMQKAHSNPSFSSFSAATSAHPADTLATAVTSLSAADQALKAGNDALALDQYQLGLGLLMQALKATPAQQKKNEIRTFMNEYLVKAETIKQRTSSSSSSNKMAAPAANNNIDSEMRGRIEGEMITSATGITFADVIGLEGVKQALNEMVILPALRPDIFTGGLRKASTGLLLYGPPGNGKTFIVKALASECKASLFCISSATLTSKLLGDSEKMVRALFGIARERAPAIIFIDEIDGILSKRGDKEHEASRRLKTEFLQQFDGVQSGDGKQHVIIIGATNTPEQLDEAVVRRLPQRIYVPLPDAQTRHALLIKLLAKQKNQISKPEAKRIVSLLDGYSASDISFVARDAAMGPIRKLSAQQLTTIPVDHISPITFEHFRESIGKMNKTVSKELLAGYEAWGKQ
jgi:SpoVK/Ycf46/Vps4 family AAA+-type ATPase